MRRVASGRLGPNDQVHITVEHLQQREQLIDGLAVVRLIEQSIQLRCRRPEPAHDLALRERAFCHSLLCFERQAVQQEIAEVGGILVVLEHLFDVHGAGAAGVEDVAERLPASLRVDRKLRDRVFGRRLRRKGLNGLLRSRGPKGDKLRQPVFDSGNLCFRTRGPNEQLPVRAIRLGNQPDAGRRRYRKTAA